MKAPSLLLLAVFLLAKQANGTVFRVPTEFATIQAAVNVTEWSDTVLVDTGIYAEAVIAPPHFFFLVGNVSPDTGYYSRPVIAPPAVTGADTSACLRMFSRSSILVEDFAFVSGTWMYPRNQGGLYPSGVAYETEEPITFRRCVFDSVSGGVDFTNPDVHSQVTIEHCVFRNVRGRSAYSRGSLRAVDCVVSGDVVSGFAALDTTEILRCTFSGIVEGGWIGLFRGGPKLISDCSFGPGIVRGTIIQTYTFDSTTISNNQIAGLGFVGASLDFMVRELSTLQVSRNDFSGCFVAGEQHGNVSITEPYDHDAIESLVVICDNHFREYQGSTTSAVAKCLRTAIRFAQVDMSGNRFTAMLPLPAPAITIDTSGSLNGLRENLFISNGFGVHNRSLDTTDARFNYWGDSTGPYHQFENPDGQGDEVRGNVLFDPWYPDTSFLDTPIRTIPSASRHALQVFPNPFNQSATLKFEIPDAGIFRIELFDLLGRRVKELYVGQVLYEKTIHVNGDDLASGIYYARAWQTTHNRPVATVKIALVK